MRRWMVASLSASILLGGSGIALAGDGKKLYDELVEQELLIEDQRWQDYVTAIGKRLLAVSSQPNAKIQFYAVDQPDFNAVAFADGYVFVYRGILASIESEDQLAHIIGHEIGHILARHPQELKAQMQTGKVLGFIGAMLTGVGELYRTADQVNMARVMGYKREAELEADRIGGELIAKAGYNPYAQIEVVQVLKDEEMFEKSISGNRITYHGLYATHPKNDKRLHEAVEAAYQYVPEETVEPIGDIWALLDGLVYGDEAADGIVRDDTFYHSSLRFVLTFPSGWRVINNNREIVGRSAQGKANGEIVVQLQNQVEKQDPEAYVKKTLKRDDVTSGESLKINDFDAYIAEVAVDPSKLAVGMLAVIYKDGFVYFFKGAADPGADVDAFKASFRATVESFRAMVKADLQIANRQRIKVIEATPKDSYKSLARQSSIKSHGEDFLRVINGDYPNGEPRPGDLVKIVQ